MHFWKNNSSYFWVYGLLMGIFCFIAGLSEGQFTVIWQKAIMICLECIGIG